MMPEATRAALERLIRDARASPALRMMALASGVNIDAQADAARKIATDGMTLDQAIAFRKATDTVAERTSVGQILKAVHPDVADDRLLLDWIWNEAQRVLSLPHPTPQPDPIPGPTPTPAPSPGVSTVHATSFLLGNAQRVCTMRYMDPSLTPTERLQARQFLLTNGYTVAYVTASNLHIRAQDGRKTFHYKPEDRAKWRAALEELRGTGLRVVLWFMGGNSTEQGKWSEPFFNTFMRSVHDGIGDLVESYCLGIEITDYKWGEARVGRHSTIAKQFGKPVFVHTGSIEQWANAKKADGFMLQFGFNKSESEIASQVRQAKADLPGKTIIACEYHMRGESDTAKKLGDAAIRAGADGVGNGCTAEGIALLAGQSPAPGPTPPPTDGPFIKSIRWANRGLFLNVENYHGSGSGIAGKLMISTPTQTGVFVDSVRYSQLDGFKTAANAFGNGQHSLNVKTGDSIAVWIDFGDGQKDTPHFPDKWPFEST